MVAQKPFSIYTLFKIYLGHWGYVSVVGHLFRMCKALSLSPSTEQNRERFWCRIPSVGTNGNSISSSVPGSSCSSQPSRNTLLAEI